MDNIEVLIHIKPDNSVWIETRGPTNTALKQVHPFDVLKAFLALEGKNTVLGTDLPRGCIHYAASLKEGTLVGQAFVLYRPEHIRTVSYYDTKYTIPIPKMVYKFILCGEHIEECYVAVVDTDNLQDRSPIYNFPFVNAFSEGGRGARICFGRNRLPRIENPKQLSGLPDYFLDLPFSEVSRDIFVRLNGMEEFPYALVAPIGAYGDFKIAWEQEE